MTLCNTISTPLYGSFVPRLLFTALPASLTPVSLKALLSAPPSGIPPPSPAPTDIKLLTTKEGRSRRMAFVGLRTQEDAEWMMDKWAGVWVEGDTGKGGGRIAVEWAKTVKEAKADHEQGRPTKRRKLSPSRTETTSAVSKPSKRLDQPEKAEDPRFKEFLSVMQPRANRSLVQDILDDTSGAPDSEVTENQEAAAKPKKTKKEKTATAESAPTPATEAPDMEVEGPRDEAVDDDGISDLEYMRRRMKRTLADAEEEQADGTEEKVWEQDEEEEEEAAEEQLEPDEDVEEVDPAVEETKAKEEGEAAMVMETGRLFVRNMPFTATSDELEQLFSTCGEVSQVHLPLDGSSRPKGLAYITFAKPAEALTALRTFDQTDFQGRLMHVMPAVTRGSRDSGPGTGATNQVKSQRDERRKQEAGREWNWASLYMNPDAVANSVASRLNISKSELFDPSSNNASVKLALAETSVINETKKYLEDQGIDTDSFSRLGGGGRSATTILVKNIPFGTPESTVQSMFGSHGEVSRVIVPPAGTMAVVEMVKPDDARAAFRALAYKRMGNAVVYLEKGPRDMWASGAGKQKPPTDTSATASATTPADAEDSEAQGEAGSTLFVKNLNFATTTAGLASTFRPLADFLFARVQTKPDPKRPSDAEARLSMGFGFVGFRTADAARQALKAMHGRRLDGHALEVKFAQRGQDDADRDAAKGSKNKPASSKLVIKNLPFEASKKEVRELFGSYGNLKSVRLPKKMDRSTRGFAFVEYVSRKEAEQAMAALKHTHLLGRHLVCDYADEEPEDLEALRVKSGGHLLKESRPVRRKFQGLDEGDVPPSAN